MTVKGPRDTSRGPFPHPPHGIRNEFDAVIRVELLDCLQQPLIADGHQLGQVEPVTLVLLHVRDDEAEVRRDEPLGGGLVALLSQSGQTPLFGGVTDQGELLYVV